MDGPLRAARLRLSVGALVALPIGFLALFYALPLTKTLGAATSDGLAWVGMPYVVGRLRIALLQAALSVALTLAIAIPLAWLHHARKIPASGALLALHAAPFVLPVFVIVYGIQLTFGRGLPPLAAVVIAHAYYNHGFAARVLHATLDRRPRRLEEAAHTLGASQGGAFWRVTMPLLLPSVAAVALLVFLFSFAAFGTVHFLGAGTISTPETLMYAQLGGAFPRTERAAALGALQLLFSLALLLAYAALLRRTRGLEHDAARARPPAEPRHVAIAFLAGLAVLVPIATVLVGGFRVAGEWSLEPWRAILNGDHPAHLAGFSLSRALGLSLAYAALATLVALALTALLAYALPRLGQRARKLVDVATTLPLGTSSLLLGLGYLLTFGAGALLDLRGTILVIVIVHALVAFPFAARILLPAFELRDPRLDEAATLLGASPLGVAKRVHLPLLAAPLAAAAGLAAAASLGDFGASLLLMRPDNMGLVVWIGRHDVAFDPLLKAQAIALTGVLTLLSAGCFFLLARRAPA